MTTNTATAGYTLFDTAVGRCGVGWTTHGIAAIQLPEHTEDEVRIRLLRRLPNAAEDAPPPAVQQAIDLMVSLLSGQQVDLSDIELDMTGVPTFNRSVYQAARQVPAGSTITYGGIAGRIGMPGAARAVGRVLGQNPFPIVVPCHRVVAASGRAGGFSATGGVNTKLAMLAAEGVGPLAG